MLRSPYLPNLSNVFLSHQDVNQREGNYGQAIVIPMGQLPANNYFPNILEQSLCFTTLSRDTSSTALQSSFHDVGLVGIFAHLPLNENSRNTLLYQTVYLIPYP